MCPLQEHDGQISYHGDALKGVTMCLNWGNMEQHQWGVLFGENTKADEICRVTKLEIMSVWDLAIYLDYKYFIYTYIIGFVESSFSWLKWNIRSATN